MLNRVELIGRLGQDPEVKEVKEGDKMAAFNVATTEYYRGEDGRNEVTDWHRVVCFRQAAEFADKYLKKGRLVYIEGKLKTRQWEEDGKPHYITEVKASHILPLDSPHKQDG